MSNKSFFLQVMRYPILIFLGVIGGMGEGIAFFVLSFVLLLFLYVDYKNMVVRK